MSSSAAHFVDDQLTTNAAPRRQPTKNVGGDGAPIRHSWRRRRDQFGGGVARPA